MCATSTPREAPWPVETMIQPLTSTDRVFVLTGAGVSAESGLPTFRGAGGLWRGHRAQDVATPKAFHANPEMVWQFYSERRKRHSTVLQIRHTVRWRNWSVRSATASSSAPRTSTPCTSRPAPSASFTCTAADADALLARRLPHRRPSTTMRQYLSPAEIPTCPECGALLRRTSAGSARCPSRWTASSSSCGSAPC